MKKINFFKNLTFYEKCKTKLRIIATKKGGKNSTKHSTLSIKKSTS